VPVGDLQRELALRFGRRAELAARAPGRVNLIGEHTDYNEGLVLPCALDRDARVVAARRDDARFRVLACDLGEVAEFVAGDSARGHGWSEYLRGVVFALRERGHRIVGLDAVVASTVPRGSGLSSSAALEVAFVTALDLAAGLGLDGLTRARLAHRAESGFVGVACGLMDQLASALGRAGCALRIDCRSLEITPVSIPAEARLLVADSGVRRELAAGAYNERRAECERALAGARNARVATPDATALRDLSPADLPALERVLDPTAFRRARHVLTENERVERTCAALRGGDLTEAGRLLREGMASLRRDFEVSVPELDALCEIGDALPGVFGSRLTGAGFGGCTVHLVQAAAAKQAAKALSDGFAARFGRRISVLEATPSEGAGPLPT
jgi:galactokinase